MNGIIRMANRKRYVSIANSVMEDTRLSWEAKGMLCYLLSKPDDWTTRPADLVKASKNGRDATATILKELEQAGYVKREKKRVARGRFEWETTIYEEPQPVELETNSPHPENPFMDEPSMVNPSMDNQGIYLELNNQINTHTARESETKAPSSLLAPQGAPKREAPQLSPRIDTATATQAQPPKPDVHSVTTTPLIDLNNPDDPAFNSPHYRAVLTACRLDPELMSHRMRGRCAVAAAKLAKKYNPAQIEAIGAACPFQTAATPEQLGDNAESWLHPRVKEIAPRYPQPTFNTAGADFTQSAILDTQTAKERAAIERAKAMVN